MSYSYRGYGAIPTEEPQRPPFPPPMGYVPPPPPPGSLPYYLLWTSLHVVSTSSNTIQPSISVVLDYYGHSRAYPPLPPRPPLPHEEEVVVDYPDDRAGDCVLLFVLLFMLFFIWLYIWWYDYYYYDYYYCEGPGCY